MVLKVDCVEYMGVVICFHKVLYLFVFNHASPSTYWIQPYAQKLFMFKHCLTLLFRHFLTYWYVRKLLTTVFNHCLK